MVIKIDYFEERDCINAKKIEEILLNLPSFCVDYNISLVSRGLSSLTRLNYINDLSIFLNWIEPNNTKVTSITTTVLESLKPIDFQRFLLKQANGRVQLKNGSTVLKKSGLKAQARKLSSIRSFYRYLFNNDMIKSNITTKVENIKESDDNHKIKRLFEDEIGLMLTAIEKNNFGDRQKSYTKNTSERDSAIISMFLGTGIRVSELVGLNISDFDFRHNCFDITRKGGKKEKLYFAEDLKSILYKWLEVRANIRLEVNENAFFISLQKRRMTVSTVEKMIKKYSKATINKSYSPHKLRATYGTELYKKTGDIYDVAIALGHKDINTTKKHSADYDDSKRRAIAGKVEVKHD